MGGHFFWAIVFGALAATLASNEGCYSVLVALGTSLLDHDGFSEAASVSGFLIDDIDDAVV